MVELHGAAFCTPAKALLGQLTLFICNNSIDFFSDEPTWPKADINKKPSNFRIVVCPVKRYPVLFRSILKDKI